MNTVHSIVYSVSQLNNIAKSYLERQFTHIIVRGEISSLKKYPSGYIYITIKDIDSEVNCVIFPDILNTSVLEVGYEFNFKGTLSVYTPKGNYQLIVHDFKKNEIGNLWERYNVLKQKLDKEGLFNKEYKKEIPKYPFNIGLISSLEGAVIHDIENVFKRRSPHVAMQIRASKVQGKDAFSDIISAINYFNKENFVDLIIIARGGGSFEDLNCFNNEELARKIFKSDIPIVTAIGHETDFTIADFVSDLRASTPSVAAEVVTKSTSEILEDIKIVYDKMYSALKNELKKYSHQYESMKNNLRFDNLDNKIQNILNNKKHLDKVLLYTIQNKISFLKQDVTQYKKRIINNDLNNIFDKGFSLVFNKKGDIVYSINNVKINEGITVQFKKGNIGAKVIEKTYKKRK